MHVKTTVFLLIFVCLLTCFIWIMEWQNETVISSKQDGKNLLDIEPEKLTNLSLYQGAAYIGFFKKETQWLIRHPIQATADNTKIYRLLAILEALQIDETITATEQEARELNLADFGLAKPTARIIVGDKNRKQTVALGCETPLKNAVYVRVDEQPSVITTSTNILSILTITLEDFRDRRLMHGSPSYVTRMQLIQLNKPMIELAKQNGEWLLCKPEIARARYDKIKGFLEKLFALKIQQFVAEPISDPAAYRLSSDEAVLQLTLWQNKDMHSRKLLFGKEITEKGDLVYVYAPDSSAVYAVPHKQVEALKLSFGDLQDSRLYFMPVESICHIQIHHDKNFLELKKNKQSEWEIVVPNRWRASTKTVSAFLNDLNTLPIAGVEKHSTTNLDTLGLAKPAETIYIADFLPPSASTQTVEQIALPSKGNQRILRVSQPVPGKEYVFAKFDDKQEIYRLSAAAVSTFSIDPLTYRDRTVLALKTAAIRAISIKRNGKEQVVEQNTDGSWKAVKPESGVVNSDAIQDILRQVASLKVMRYEGTRLNNLAAYGLDIPKTLLMFRLTGEEGIQKTIMFGKESESHGVYARLQGQDAVFLLDPHVASLLIKDLIR